MKRNIFFYAFTFSVLFFITSCSKDDAKKNEPQKNTYLSEIDGDKMLEIINRYRTSGCMCGSDSLPPVSPLVWNVLLEKAALKHTKDMNDNNFFSHTGSDSSKANERIKAQGYIYKNWGENILMGTHSTDVAMDTWMKSEGHCKNLMNKSFKEIGAAKVGVYWTQDFGVQ
ncbi:MAG: CAP domain-containing protein [Chitinophagales bacterium]|nr:CAP domain-containing protein [Chitinophagales bacterium]